jgi:hypothetical protein
MAQTHTHTPLTKVCSLMGACLIGPWKGVKGRWGSDMGLSKILGVLWVAGLSERAVGKYGSPQSTIRAL